MIIQKLLDNVWIVYKTDLSVCLYTKIIHL